MSLRTEAKAGVVRIAAYHWASAGKGVGGEGNRTWQPRPLGIRWLSPQSCGQPKKRGSMNSMKTHLVGIGLGVGCMHSKDTAWAHGVAAWVDEVAA